MNFTTLKQASENTIETQILAHRTERHFCQCYTCHQKTTIDFEVVVWEYKWYNSQMQIDVWEPRTTYYRLDGDEQKTEVRNTYIATCPRCGDAKPQNSQLRESKVKIKPGHICDDRCQTAISDACVCSCNGRMHGIKHKHQGTLF